MVSLPVRDGEGRFWKSDGRTGSTVLLSRLCWFFIVGQVLALPAGSHDGGGHRKKDGSLRSSRTNIDRAASARRRDVGASPATDASLLLFSSISAESKGTMLVIEPPSTRERVAGEVKEPGRVLPKAILISVVAVALIYALMNLSIIGVIPWREALLYDLLHFDLATVNVRSIPRTGALLDRWRIRRRGHRRGRLDL